MKEQDMPSWRLPVIGALALAVGLTPLGSVMAAPAAVPPSVAKADVSTVIEVGRRFHRHHGHHHGHRHRGRNLAIGLGVGIIGGLIAAEAYRNAPAYADDEVYDAPPPAGDPRQLCAREFRSFEWSTGLYTTHSGERKLCPYLQ
jgi:hypothetical protein